MSAYQFYRDELSRAGVDLHPSELHGMLIGYLCAVKDQSGKEQRQSLFNTWLDGSVPEGLENLLEQAWSQGLDSLGEYSDFDFKLLVPDDDAAVTDRAQAVAVWCSGFLSGFGESGRQLASDEASDVKEALQDIGRIAAMTDEVPEGEENEADLTEIVEFVRVSTLLIFAETGSQGAH